MSSESFIFFPKSKIFAEWQVEDGLVPYDEAIRFMKERVENIIYGRDKELIWLLEHPPLYSAGTSAKESDLIDKNKLPIYKSGRGGQYTYHGPGQRVIYVMLDLKKRKKDIRAFVKALESWIIDALGEHGIKGELFDDKIGVWVRDRNGDIKKIAAIGIRVSRWVSFHGISLNINPDLSHYSGIVPCGISDYGVTSLADLGCDISMNEFDKTLKLAFEKRFGLTSIIED